MKIATLLLVSFVALGLGILNVVILHQRGVIFHDLEERLNSQQLEIETLMKEIESASSFHFNNKRQRVAIIMPYILKHVERVKENLHKWEKFFPCRLERKKTPYTGTKIDFILYSNKVMDKYIIDNFRSILKDSGAAACLDNIYDMSADLNGVIDTEMYAHKGIGTQFLSLFTNKDLTEAYDYFFYMEPDSVPIRPLWMDRLYNEIQYYNDFWVKGSIYRGPNKPLDYCPTFYGCAEHMNGNAIYKLGDPEFNALTQKILNEMNFDAWNFDTYIMHLIKREDNWNFYQKYAHKFVYTEFIQHGNNVNITVADIVDLFPNTFVVHQPRYSL